METAYETLDEFAYGNNYAMMLFDGNYDCHIIAEEAMKAYAERVAECTKKKAFELMSLGEDISKILDIDINDFIK